MDVIAGSVEGRGKECAAEGGVIIVGGIEGGVGDTWTAKERGP